MKCEEIERIISVNIDGALDRSELEQLKAHLATCVGCNSIYKEWQAMDRLLKDTLSDRPRRAINLPIEPRPKLWLTISIAAAAGIILVIAISILSLPKDVEVVSGEVTVSDGKISTGADQQGIVKLFNRSLVELAPKTKLVVDKAKATTEHVVKLNQGAATFQVEKQSAKPFVVRTDIAEIKVLGTKFRVNTDSGGKDMKKLMTVMVLAGIVQVTNAQGTALVEAFETAYVVQDNAPTKLSSQEKENVAALLKELAQKEKSEWFDFVSAKLKENPDLLSLEGKRALAVELLKEDIIQKQLKAIVDPASKVQLDNKETEKLYKELLIKHQDNDCLVMKQIEKGGHASKVLHGSFKCKFCKGGELKGGGHDFEPGTGCPTGCMRFACKRTAEQEGVCNLCGKILVGQKLDSKPVLEIHKKTCNDCTSESIADRCKWFFERAIGYKHIWRNGEHKDDDCCELEKDNGQSSQGPCYVCSKRFEAGGHLHHLLCKDCAKDLKICWHCRKSKKGKEPTKKSDCTVDIQESQKERPKVEHAWFYIGVLAHKDGELRQCAAFALSHVASNLKSKEAEEAALAVIDVLEDPLVGVRWYAALTLAKLAALKTWPKELVAKATQVVEAALKKELDKTAKHWLEQAMLALTNPSHVLVDPPKPPTNPPISTKTNVLCTKHSVKECNNCFKVQEVEYTIPHYECVAHDKKRDECSECEETINKEIMNKDICRSHTKRYCEECFVVENKDKAVFVTSCKEHSKKECDQCFRIYTASNMQCKKHGKWSVCQECFRKTKEEKKKMVVVTCTAHSQSWCKECMSYPPEKEFPNKWPSELRKEEKEFFPQRYPDHQR